MPSEAANSEEGADDPVEQAEPGSDLQLHLLTLQPDEVHCLRDVGPAVDRRVRNHGR